MPLLAEIREETDGGSSVTTISRIAIGINKSHSGRQALRWALDKMIPSQALVCLIHVQTPLRSIPNGIGGKYPVENVSPETVQKYKEQLFQEIEKVMKECRMLCERKKVRTEIHYVEHDTVQKGLLDQIYKLGITSLVLGKSPQNAITRALKKDVPSSVLKHAPKFCTVMVVCKGKLFSVKDATQNHLHSSSARSSNSATIDISASERSETSFSSADTNQDESRTSGHIDYDEKTVWPGVKNDESIIGSPSTDFSDGRFLFAQSGTNVEGDSSPALPAILRTKSSPNRAKLSYPEPDTNIEDSWRSPGPIKTQSATSRSQGSMSTLIENDLTDQTALDINDEVRESITLTEPPGDSPSSVSSMYMTMDDSEIILYPNFGHLSQSNIDTGRSETLNAPEETSSQRIMQELEDVSSSSTMGVPSNEVIGRSQTLNAPEETPSQRTSQELEDGSSSSTMGVPSNELAERDEALQQARAAQLKASIESKKYEEALALLKDQESLEKKIEEEAKRNQETRAELENLKRLLDNYSVETNLAKQQAEAERKKCEETLMKLEEVTRKLEAESQLRKEAEEKAFQEVTTNVADVAIYKEQRKFSEYNFQELQTATNDFHEDNKLGEGGYGPVYKGKLYNTDVVIKVLASQGSEGADEFHKQVEFMSTICHPHMVTLLGVCSEKCCLVYEYMSNGSLEDHLNRKDEYPPFPWYMRFRLCLDIATALLFLHSRPQPIIHHNLKPGNILFDDHFVCKIGDTGLSKLVPNSMTIYKESTLVGTMAYIDPDYQRTGVISCESDVYSLGIIMLQILTGRPAVGVADLVEDAVDNGRLEDVLDKSAGEWPLSEAMVLASLSMQCTEPRRRHRPNLGTKILPDLERIQDVADTAAVCTSIPSFSTKPIVPSFFFCPLSQKIMKNPQTAADGFTYEHDMIKVWLQERDTSPMTNMTLSHKNLTPNLKLRSIINEWQEKGLLT
ncbi:hypothetical protein KP509_29G060600 [Ceratopteris richardii]|uniref:RING-type E3 ubiquitin transferase n=1 Tax=Ceratopteris richardii TaxID=49495 RepID=A0A8T2R999_CERRI|nr:hypothetical protein KP509_29G060600 [Ceratopteris richardii]